MPNRLLPRLLALAAVVVASACNIPERPAEVGKAAPAYAAETLDGETVALRELRGDVVLLNVWATWCRPCVREMPSLEALHQELSPHGLNVVAVSIDGASSGGEIRSFLQTHGISFTILHDPGKRVAREFATIGLPETYLISRDGRVLHHWIGMIDGRSDRVRGPVLQALAE